MYSSVLTALRCGDGDSQLALDVGQQHPLAVHVQEVVPVPAGVRPDAPRLDSARVPQDLLAAARAVLLELVVRLHREALHGPREVRHVVLQAQRAPRPDAQRHGDFLRVEGSDTPRLRDFAPDKKTFNADAIGMVFPLGDRTKLTAS